MKRFVFDGKKKPEKLYKICDVAKAVYKSESSVQGYFSNRKISTKKGVTLEQVFEYLTKNGTRGQGINWRDVEEIRNRLMDEMGAREVEDQEMEGAK